jgi:ketosteroid isomerase-like protein
MTAPADTAPSAGNTPSASNTPSAGPREVFGRWQQLMLSNDPGGLGQLSSDDVIIETPFAPPGHPRRFEGLGQFLAYARPRMAALPARFEEFRNVVVHDTANPQVIIAEYDLCGTVTTTGEPAAASFVAILTVRDSEIVHWREYQDTLGMAASLGQLPALLASLGVS